MKNIIKFSLIALILAILIIGVTKYIVNAYSNDEEEFVYEETISLSNLESTNRSSAEEKREIQTEDVEENIILKDEKYTTEYETTNGEKYTIIGNLKIPKINIDYDILSSTSVALLKVSLNRYWGAGPNEVGNMCIVGHNYLDSRFFGRLHTLKYGDAIQITDSYGRTLEYYVYDMFVADPYDTRCTTQLTNGEKEITLITCYNKGTQRLVVKARAEKDKTVEATKKVINKILDSIK